MYKTLCRKIYRGKLRYGLDLNVFHAITSGSSELMYFPIPKNMCTTLKLAFYQMENGHSYSASKMGIDLHQFYFKNPQNYYFNQEIVKTNHTKVVIVREPISRFISAFRNRIIDLGDLEPFKPILDKANLDVKPDINQFIENLSQYRQLVHSVKHHTEPQINFIGKDLSKFDLIVDIRDPSKLLSLIKERSNITEFKREKSGGTKASIDDITPANLSVLKSFYKRDLVKLEHYMK